MTISEQLRAAMATSGLTRYAIGKELGIPESVLSRFAAGGGLRSDTIDALGDHLGLELSPIKRTVTRKPARKGDR